MNPICFYGLKVPPNGKVLEANPGIPAPFRITMAAIDPTESPELGDPSTRPRTTLKIIRDVLDVFSDDDEDDDDDDDEDEEDDEDDDESSSEDEMVNGGPSDPEKIKSARQQAVFKAMERDEAESSEDEDVDMSGLSNGINGSGKLDKGKGKLDDHINIASRYEYVVCTLDPNQHFQQPIDITIGEDESCFFTASGTHSIHLTGNFLSPRDSSSDDEDSMGLEELQKMYGLEGLGDEASDDDEEDELDDLEDPRVMEVGSDDEEAPKLVKVAAKPTKAGSKRPAEDSDEASDEELGAAADAAADEMLKLDKGEKLSKRQAKKLKTNAGQAVAGSEKSAKDPTKGPAKAAKPESTKKGDVNSKEATGKKVQFAEKLEQGPTPSGKPKGPRNVGGVLVDDKKPGKGPAAKKGDKCAMRYIGKLKDGKVFDSNKKGKPFEFKLGTGAVIKGWDVGVTGMSPGGERRITVPAHLAYGSKAMPGIPSNSELVFDLKMISIN